MRSEGQPLGLYLWYLSDYPVASEEMIRRCARIYAENAGNSEALALLKQGAALARKGKGKPYFPSLPGLHFSLSHSGQYGACAFYHKPVGLDLQIHRDCNREAIARRFFHSKEYHYLKEKEFTPFFDVWVAKESYVKYSGAGLGAGLQTFSVVDAHGLRDSLDGLRLFHHFNNGLPDNYSMCLCAGSASEEEIGSCSILRIGYSFGRSTEV